MTEPTQRGPHLLPHERWLASKAFRRREAPAGSARWRLWQNYGPKGVALMMAMIADTVAAWLLGLLAFVLLGVSDGAGALGDTGYVIGLIAIAATLLGFFRMVQATSAGRKFRNGRAFIRPSGSRWSSQGPFPL